MYLNFENPYQMDSNDVKMNNRGNCYLKLSKWTVRVILPRYVSKISCYVSLHNRTRDLLKMYSYTIKLCWLNSSFGHLCFKKLRFWPPNKIKYKIAP